MSERMQTQAKAAESPTLTPPSSGLLQRKCACGGTPGVDDLCAECRSKRLSAPAERTEAPPIVHEVLRSPGRSLDAETRSFMEPRFGHDFSQIRVHADSRAAASAEAVRALAYTVGQAVVFGAGQYEPGTTEGRRMVAHELVHVVQQEGRATSSPSTDLPVGDIGDAYEQEAEAVAQRLVDAPVLTHRAPLVQQSTAGPLVSRQTGETMVGPPTIEEAAQRVLVGATRILGIPNFISKSVTHMNAVQGLPAGNERYMLFEFWLAVAGLEVQAGPTEGGSNYRRATAAERLARLTHANETATTLIDQLGPAPWLGQTGEVVRAYQVAYSEARVRVMSESVEAELESRPTPVTYEAPEFELEQQRLAVENTLAALAQYGLLAARLGATTGARFSKEIEEALDQIAARAPEGSRLAGIAKMDIPGAILRARGVLNGINAVLQIADPDRRAKLLASEFNVRDVAAASRVLVGLTEGLVATTSLIGSHVARAIGKTAAASSLLKLGTSQFVRRIGWIASMAQTIHGIAVLLDEGVPESARLEAVLDVAMGTAGLTGAAAALGVKALAGVAGPLSAGIAITAGEVAYLRHLIRGMEGGMATGGIRESFDLVEYEAGGVARFANELAEAMSYAQENMQGPPVVGQPGELTEAANREVQFKSRQLREFLTRAIDRVTQRQPEFAILFQPASWAQVRQPFEALRPSLHQATTPDALLAVASAYLAAARELFRNLARTITLSLRDVDRSRAGDLLPSILGGLHETRQVTPYSTQIAP